MGATQDLLERCSFGERTAESEAKDLGHYFVETAPWKRIRAGEKDIVYGPKGAGKSAIYTVMLERSGELLKERIVVKVAVTPQEAPEFAEMLREPPSGEAEWRALWRGYFLCLIAEILIEWGVQTDAAKRVHEGLERHGLGDPGKLKTISLRVREFIRRVEEAKRLEGSAEANPMTGGGQLGGAIDLGDESDDRSLDAAIAVSGLLNDANTALEEAGVEVWIAIDRLDAGFPDESVERAALRALMRVYLDTTTLGNISPKIFLRADLWERIVEADGFREGSHVVRSETIRWSRDTLLNLMIRRILDNDGIVERYGVEPQSVLASVDLQEELFAQLFERPEDEREGWNAVDWMVASTQDGRGRSAPREIIHLLTSLRDQQIERLEVGRPDPEGEVLFEPATFGPAVTEVSVTHLNQTLYNESPKLRPLVEPMRGGKTFYTAEGLQELWSLSEESARNAIDGLLGAGFFRRVPAPNAGFEVAMLYRPGLELRT